MNRNPEVTGSPQTPPSFVLVKPSSLGDIIHALPSLHFLRQAHPKSKISWIANTEWLPLLEHVKGIDELIAFPRRELRGIGAVRGFLQWANSNRSTSPANETVIDLQGLLRSALISRSRRSQRIVGASDAREGAPAFYHIKAPISAGCHAVEHNLAVMEAAGIPCPKDAIQFPFGPGSKPKSELPDQFILLHPYSRGAGKTLDAGAIQHLIDQIAPLPLVLVGSRPVELHPANGDHVLDLCGQTSLGELLWLSRTAQSVISVDSGPLHIAAAVNDSVLGIHTWSDPRVVGPYGDQALVWKAGNICRPSDLSQAEASHSSVPEASDLEKIAISALEAR